jgi:hypothetical protein
VAGAETVALDLRDLLVQSAGADEEYEVEFGYGAAGFEVALTRVHFQWLAAGGGRPIKNVPIPSCPRVPVGARVAARMRNNTANQRTIEIRLGYIRNSSGL